MRFLRTLLLCLPVFLLLRPVDAFTQNPAPAARIVEKIDANQLVTLRGNVLPAAIARNDLGPVRSDLAMNGLVLALSRGPEQQAAFDQFVASQYDPGSPNFHHWLRADQVGERFGPAAADIAAVTNWLTSSGFAVSEISKDRMSIRFSGTARQVEAAFHTSIHNLSVHGEHHIANMTDPQIPAALAPVVLGVKALHDFKPRPLHRMGGIAAQNRDTGKWFHVSPSLSPSVNAKAAPAASGRPRPAFGTTDSNSDVLEDVTPYDFATIYNVAPLWSANIDGTGQVIAIAGTSDIRATDVSTFRSSFGLPAGPALIQVHPPTSPDPGVCTAPSTATTCNIDDQTENALDVEWAGAIAPGAQVVLVSSGMQSQSDDTLWDSSNYIVQNAGVSGSPVANANILSVSYGLCELFMGTSGNAAYSQLWQTAATEGIAVIVASGDAGSASCDQGLDTSVPYEATYGKSVSGIASTPFDTAVGGTDLNWGSSPSTYWNSSNAPNDSNALGYMPELPWNDTCTNPLTLTFLQQQIVPALQGAGQNPTPPTDAESACQFVLTWYQFINNNFQNADISGFVDVVGAGGGASSCTSNDGQTVASCAGGYTKPSWQANVTGIPNDGKRDLPDVSFFASNGFVGSAYLICVSDAGSCTYSSTSEPTAQEVGGTSAAAPAMAGVMALINQKAGTPQGNPNQALYTLAATQNYNSCKSETGTTTNGCYFNDVDTGTITMPCAPGSTTDCTVAHSGDTVAVLNGHDAGVGYDLATGLGTLNVANIVNGIGQSPTIGPATATVNVAPSATSISVAQAITVSVTVSGSSGTPTGTVTLSGGGYLGGSQTLANGAFTFNVPAFGLTGGTDTLAASYSGDNNYSQARSIVSVTVAKVAASAISINVSAPSIASNAQLTVTGAVTGVSGGPTPTGTVTLSSGSFSANATLSGGNYSITVPANTLAVGTDTLTVAYSGDGTYTGISNSTQVTITQPVAATFSLSATAPAAINRGTSATSTITVNSTTGYTGSVTLACALTSGPTNQSADAPACTIPTTVVGVGKTATATVTTKAATTSALVRPDLRRNSMTFAGLGGAALVLLALLGIPARRRSWHAMLGLLVLLIALSGLAACGGGSGSSSGGSGGGNGGGGANTDPGTASGTYTFTVTGTGSPAVTPAPTTTFTVTVN